MRLDRFFTPEALALSVSTWSRPEIEAAIDTLIALLDTADGIAIEASAEAGLAPSTVGDGVFASDRTGRQDAPGEAED
ncbi:MAG TPA: hypothetical protein VME92_20635 [Acetobacteraceae bacterium]|nr:hypothetical protein [Acetobacteraceae bacterium]